MPNKTERESSVQNDLPESRKDQESLEERVSYIDLPEVKDIPGQEHIHVPRIGEMADTTISSDDEEGKSVFDDGHEEDFEGEPVVDSAIRDEDDEDETSLDSETNVTDDERETLRRADEDMPTQDDIRLRRAELDRTDFDGDPLNEGSLATDVSGSDLDVPGSEDDDENEEIGEEDEENNSYSLGSDDNEK